MTTTAVAPPPTDVSKTAGYSAKLSSLLGERDPLEVLRTTPDVLAREIAPHPASILRRRPYEGKWTPCEIIGHLSDTEFVYGYRVRMVQSQDRPQLFPMDQDQWVVGQHYNERDPIELIEQFRALRRITIVMWKNVAPEQFDRIGLHAERGEESLRTMLKMHAGHDLSHIDQFMRYLKAALESPVAGG